MKKRAPHAFVPLRVVMHPDDPSRRYSFPDVTTLDHWAAAEAAQQGKATEAQQRLLGEVYYALFYLLVNLPETGVAVKKVRELRRAFKARKQR